MVSCQECVCSMYSLWYVCVCVVCVGCDVSCIVCGLCVWCLVMCAVCFLALPRLPCMCVCVCCVVWCGTYAASKHSSV